MKLFLGSLDDLGEYRWQQLLVECCEEFDSVAFQCFGFHKSHKFVAKTFSANRTINFIKQYV